MNRLSYHNALEVRLPKYADLNALADQLLGFYVLGTLGLSVELGDVLVADYEQSGLLGNRSANITPGSCSEVSGLTARNGK